MTTTKTQLRQMSDAIAAHEGFDADWYAQFFARQAAGENTDAQWNPLATTQPYDGATDFNDAGVKNYRTMDDGIQATLMTLNPTIYGGNDYYPTVRRAIHERNLDYLPYTRTQVAREIQTWGTMAFAQDILDGWSPEVAPPIELPSEDGVAPAGFADVVQREFTELRQELANLNQAVLIRFDLLRRALNVSESEDETERLINDAADPDYFARPEVVE